MRWTMIVTGIWSSCLALASRAAGLGAFARRVSQRMQESRTGQKEKRLATQPAKDPSPRTAIVKSRPQSLEDRYRPLDDIANLDNMFLRMRERLYGAADALSSGSGSRSGKRRPHVVLREAGRIGPKRPYFYLKPMNEAGWLFERSGYGWVVSRAEKIVGKDTFLRRGEPWDVVTLHEATTGSNTIRVTSQRIGGQLIPFSVYESKLGEEMFEQMGPHSGSGESLNDYLTGD